MSASEWLRRLGASGEPAGSSDAKMMTFILEQLKGPARLWHFNHGMKHIVFEHLKKAFETSHVRVQKKTAIFSELNNLQQGNRETIIYVRQKETLCIELVLHVA